MAKAKALSPMNGGNREQGTGNREQAEGNGGNRELATEPSNKPAALPRDGAAGIGRNLKLASGEPQAPAGAHLAGDRAARTLDP